MIIRCALQFIRAAAFGAMLAGLPGVGLAQDTLLVELRAPDSVRPLLERHVRLLTRSDLSMPEERADRIALIRRTRREVSDLLATQGYFAAQVSIERSESGPWVLAVEPGEQAKIVSVEVSFAGHVQDSDAALEARRKALRAAWALPVGQPFLQSAWDAAKQQLLDQLSVRDYAAARISASRAEVDPESASVRLSVTVDSGPPFRFGALEVSGHEQLPTDLVERLSTIRAGERFDQDRLMALQAMLQNAPQFASVVVDIDRNRDHAAAAAVRVHITEARTRHLAFGTGYSTNTGARVEVNWRDLNLLDRAWELSTGLRIEQRRQSAYADVFLPPQRSGHRISVGGLVESSDLAGLQTTRQAIGIVRSRPRGDTEISTTLRYQREKLSPQGAPPSSRNALTANWTWTRRRVDNLLDPRDGYVLQVEFGGGTRALLSDQDFFRSYGRLVRYQPVGTHDVFIVRAEVGATLAKSRDGIPQDFLFRTGGAQSVRGYAYNSLGVREGRATVGGRFLGAASAEYVHWFKPLWGVAAFADVGDAADDRSRFTPRVGYGVGARWRSPGGPLALDLAYGRHDRRVRLHFAIAVAF